MSFFTDLDHRLEALRDLLGGELDAAEIPETVKGLPDEAVVSVITATSAAIRALESARIAAAGIVAARSRQEAGQSGLAQTRGHRSTVSLIQDLTGASRSEAAKQVRIGEGLTEKPVAGPETGGADDAGAPPEAPPRPWHAPLDDALLNGTISSTQHDAIRRGLGDPPPSGEDGPSAAQVDDAWSVAAEQLLTEAASSTVEDLVRTARLIRDRIDPEGAARRFDERYRARSFRMWTDADGIHRAALSFDDEAALWVRTIIDTALRPRRGGPRFVDAAEREQAERLAADPRSNDQLAYDLLIDVLRAGALADAEKVFGARQPGVRVVVSAGDLSAGSSDRVGIGMSEDAPHALPAWLIAQHACTVGTRVALVDDGGNPLRLGRTQRLFTAAQRVALALRDGGCRWPGCDRPASYGEAHHIDPWHDGGRTDVDRGILLCRFHHRNLHHHRWRITRDGDRDFVLHPPGGGAPIPLRPPLALRYAWGDHAPPPARAIA